MPLSELDSILIERTIFRNVLLASEDGRSVLGWLGNECGAWSQDPAVVKPELIALWNKLLGMLGIVRGDNIMEIASRLALAANDNDIALERRQHGGRESSGESGGQ